MGQLYAETQRIAAGDDFDGTVPTIGSDEDYGRLIFAAGAAGGLFVLHHARLDDGTLPSPESKRMKRIATKIHLKLADQTSWTLSIHDLNTGTDIVLLTGTTETDIVLTDVIELMPEERLKLETSGASQALEATVVYTTGQLR